MIWSFCKHILHSEKNSRRKESGKDNNGLDAEVDGMQNDICCRCACAGLRARCCGGWLLGACSFWRRGLRCSRVGRGSGGRVGWPVTPNIFPSDASVVEAVCELLDWLVNSQTVEGTVAVIGAYPCWFRAFGKEWIVSIGVGNTTCGIFNREFILGWGSTRSACGRGSCCCGCWHCLQLK